ncbi:MAG: ABC transporter ATP-binding protein, partial [Lachnospiraceae bacterium]|nr:ABC transporter ATP-binding protein [Lachnospiraceae bacterium]
MRKLLRYMKGYRKKALLAPLFKLLEASMELCVPLIVKAIIDRGIGQEDRPFLIKMTLLMVLFGLLGYGFALCAQYFAAKVATEFTGRVRYALFDHIQSLSYSDLDRLGTATLITRMTSDTVQIQNGVNLTLRLLLRSPFIVFGALIMA